MANYRQVATDSVNHGIGELKLTLSNEDQEHLIRFISHCLFEDEKRFFHTDLFKRALKDLKNKNRNRSVK